MKASDLRSKMPVVLGVRFSVGVNGKTRSYEPNTKGTFEGFAKDDQLREKSHIAVVFIATPENGMDTICINVGDLNPA